MSVADNILAKIKNTTVLTGEFIAGDLIKELEGQGHVSTRKLIESIAVLDRFIYNVVQVDIEFEDYYVYVEYGVTSSQIKHKFAKARINALQNWWIRHGLSEKEALSAAYATAYKHSQEGMPTQNSWKYSENGRRLHFIDETIDNNKYILEYEETLLDILEESGIAMIDALSSPFKVFKTAI